MSDQPSHESRFTSDERAVLHSLAEMFQDKPSRDALRQLLHEGATLREIIMAYRTQRRLVIFLKSTALLISAVGAAVLALKQMNLWPK